MRFTHRDGTEVLLSYCTNVHAAQDVAGIVDQFDRYAAPIRDRLGWSELGLGLWLPASAATALAADPPAIRRLRKELTARALAVVTVNGFPYGDFHGERVKKKVYRPDWTDRRRLDYTVHLANILAALLPDEAAEGSISTLPLGWRASWTAADGATAAGHLHDLARELDTLRARTGRTVRVGLEPEPGCVLERGEDLAPGLPPGLGPMIGLCLDTCHLAVGFEQPRAFLDAAAAAGAPIVKVQAASALHAEQPHDPDTAEALRHLDEPRYLHQVRCRGAHPGRVAGVDDLPQAAGTLPTDRPWRVHFHAPLHAEHVGALSTTRDVLDDALTALFAGPHPATGHLEVETYTWPVLPGTGDAHGASGAHGAGGAGENAGAGGGAGPHDLVEGIAEELTWTAGRLAALGLEGKCFT